MKATIERATLLRCLSHVQSVVERRNTIPILSNVLIEASEGGAVKVMATDLDLQVVETMSAAAVESPGAITVSAHLLFDIARKLPDGAAGMPDVIVPRKAVGELRKLLDEALDGNVLVDLSASKIRFTLGGEGGVVLTSKLIDGTFPDYSRVIPTGNDKLLKVDPKLFFAGVDRVATIATEKTRAVKMGLEPDKVTLSVTSPDNGTATEELAASYESEGFEIGFNANYLKDILDQIDADEVELHLADAGAPTLIRKDESSPALYVLMPMRV